jgi:hypothetical protein
LHIQLQIGKTQNVIAFATKSAYNLGTQD